MNIVEKEVKAATKKAVATNTSDPTGNFLCTCTILEVLLTMNLFIVTVLYCSVVNCGCFCSS